MTNSVDPDQLAFEEANWSGSTVWEGSAYPGPAVQGVIFSNDILQGLDLRDEHFHCFSTHGEGGHYHWDTTPQVIEYRGYFTVAELLYRIDKPPKP